MNKNIARYRRALEYLDGFINLPNAYPHDGRRMDLYDQYTKRMRFFLDLLGKPDQDLRVIHVAGTSGKGTTSSYIQSILTAAGYKTGLYTTPYATSFIEEFKVGNKYIAPEQVSKLIEYLKPFIDQSYAKSPFGGPSHFEIKTALGLLYFKSQKCDYVVLETGLGGEFDATNVVPNKVATAITNVGFDHTDILGKKITDIARAKAGIIKEHAPLFTTETKPGPLRIFKAICRKKKASIALIKSDKPNQTLAVRLCEYLGVKNADIKKGIQNAFIPCRFERMPSSNVILDGAHNPDKIKYLVKKIKQEKKSKPLTVIFGAAQNKDAAKMLNSLSPIADKIILTRFSNPFRKAWNPHELAKQPKSKTNSVFLDSNEALETAQKITPKDGLILVTGSFFLCGELRTHWYLEEQILNTRQAK